jgi:UDP-GlcNAc3NAcA epimerase
MIKLMTVVGARPQFIKAAVLSRKIQTPEYSSRIQEFLVHTGQHFDANMSQVFFDELGIPSPFANLEINSGTHAEQTGRMMVALEKTTKELKPDCILVYGDTNSTLAASLVAAKAGIPLAHVEAGLRSFRVGMPEEVNRVATDSLSQFLFCPNDSAVKQLQKEGKDKNVLNVGDIMFDSFKHYEESLTDISKLVPNKDFVFLTLHRQENTDHLERFNSLISLVNQVSMKVPIVFAIHPRTKKVIEQNKVELAPTVHCIPPQGYQTVVSLLTSSKFVITDSGGLQKEAFFASKPCLTLRDETEWTETLRDDWNKLMDQDFQSNLDYILNRIESHDYSVRTPLLFGDGKSADKTLDHLIKNL